MKVEITPLTRIGDMLDSYPELEDELIRVAPVFRKLRNPVLRRTVAKVATVAKAASVAGIDPRELVARLRREAGQPPLETDPEHTADREWPKPPESMQIDTAKVSIDADALLAAGEVPLTAATTAARDLAHGEFVAIASSFIPAPLLEALGTQGYEVFVRRLSPDRFETFARNTRISEKNGVAARPLR